MSSTPRRPSSGLRAPRAPHPPSLAAEPPNLSGAATSLIQSSPDLGKPAVRPVASHSRRAVRRIVVTMSPIVLVSNRGPVNWQRTDGGLVAKRGAGGLVSGLAPLVAG